MIHDLETQLRQLGDTVARDVPAGLHPSSNALRRIRRGRAVRSIVVVAALSGLTIGGFAVRAALVTGSDRSPFVTDLPAELTGNGAILHSGDGFAWHGDEAPPPPSGPAYPGWVAFDQGSGSFLVPNASGTRVWIVGPEGTLAEFRCPRPIRCGGSMSSFGPGPDEVTVATRDGSVLVLDFDGTIRRTIDVSAALADDTVSGTRSVADLEWSLDGERLAVSTKPTAFEPGVCDGTEPCVADIWIFERRGGQPRMVHAEPATATIESGLPNPPVVTNLAWSPDGERLAYVVGAIHRGLDPRLVVLRVPRQGEVATATLHTFDAGAWGGAGEFLTNDDDSHYAFAWSPDGTRLAVTDDGGIIEISGETGDLLARWPGQRIYGPLAWMRER